MLYRLYQPGDFAALYAVEELCFEPPFRFSRAYMRQLIAKPQLGHLDRGRGQERWPALRSSSGRTAPR